MTTNQHHHITRCLRTLLKEHLNLSPWQDPIVDLFAKLNIGPHIRQNRLTEQAGQPYGHTQKGNTP